MEMPTSLPGAAAAMQSAYQGFLSAASSALAASSDDRNPLTADRRRQLADATALAIHTSKEYADQATKAATGELLSPRPGTWQGVFGDASEQPVTEAQTDQLLAESADALEAAEYVGVGRWTLPGEAVGDSGVLTIPAAVPLLGRGNLVVAAPEPAGAQIVQRIVWEALARTVPGDLKVIVYDPSFSGLTAPFAPLGTTVTKTVREYTLADAFTAALADLEEQTRHVNSLLGGNYPGILDLRKSQGGQFAKFTLVVLPFYTPDRNSQLHRRLVNLAKAGPRAGVSWVFHIADEQADLDDFASVGRVIGNPAQRHQLQLEVGAIPTSDLSSWSGRLAPVIVKASSRAATIRFRDIEDTSRMWWDSSAQQMVMTLGKDGERVVSVALGDSSVNVLVTGAVGMGKSNLLLTAIHSLCQRYSPDEVTLYLLDLKEGATLARFTPDSHTPDFLPHARVLGLYCDPEFCVSVLADLVAEIKKRQRAFKEAGSGVAKLADYRAACPNKPMPRILVLIDEFQRMFLNSAGGGEDMAATAVRLLEDIYRTGRASGVHLVLSTQTIADISALRTIQSGLLSNFAVRIALKTNTAEESYTALTRGNNAAQRLPGRGEAILNTQGGLIDANQHLVVAYTDDEPQVKPLRAAWYQARPDRPPYVYDGEKPCLVGDFIEPLKERRRRVVRTGGAREALCGRQLTMGGEPIHIPLGPGPGRHLAVIGQLANADVPLAENPAVGMLQMAAISLALQHPLGDADFVCFDFLGAGGLMGDFNHPWLATMEQLGHPVWLRDGRELRPWLVDTASELDGRDGSSRPLYAILIGMDGAGLLDETPPAPPGDGLEEPSRAGRQTPTYKTYLHQLITRGPLCGVHVLGWWQSASAFNTQLRNTSMIQPNMDARVLLRMTKSTAKELTGIGFSEWESPEMRALYFDATMCPTPVAFHPAWPTTKADMIKLLRVDWGSDA